MTELPDTATVFHLKPSDVLLIGNLGEHDPEDLRPTLRKLMHSLKVKQIYLFEADIDVQVVSKD